MGNPSANSLVSLLICLVVMAPSISVMARSWNDGIVSSVEGIIPSSLAVSQSTDPLQQVLLGTGVQIYVYNSTAWVNTNVSADLYNFEGLKVGHHFFLGEVDRNGGKASWETFSPASRVTGKELSSVSQEDSIPWLLLEATTNSGKKRFGSTNFVQRLYTHQGLPPAADVPAKEGETFESNYSALYAFSASKKLA